jgi:acetyl esterase/lipase
MKKLLAFFSSIIFLTSSCGDYDSTIQSSLENYSCSLLEDSLYNKNMNYIKHYTTTQEYKNTTFTNYCKTNILTDTIAGNLQNPSNYHDTWTLSLGSALLLSSLDQTTKHMPYIKEVEYKNINGCSLAIRIYIKNLNNLGSKKLKPLLFFHGGGWSYRKLTATTAIDIIAPNFTEKDYVLFSPVHRLIKNKSGPKECQNATAKQILEDSNDALSWILENMHLYGVKKDLPITIAGQSSGAHLATYLATKENKKINKALLFYPVTDFKFLLKNLNKGGLYEGEFLDSKNLFYNFLNLDEKSTSTPKTDAFIQENSFPEIVAKNPVDFPTFYILHGMKDSVAPVEMSTRMCEALDTNISISNTKYSYKQHKTLCDNRGSVLFTVKNADHMLELKCLDPYLQGLYPLNFSKKITCSAGSLQGESLVREALEYAFSQFL